MERPTPPRPAGPSSPGGGRIGDRLGQIASSGARRTRTSWIVYGVLGVTVVVIAFGQLMGWWQSPVERKIREEVERRKAAEPPRAPTPAPTPGDAPVPPR